MKKSLLKVLATVLVGTMTVGMLAGCGGSTKSSTTDTSNTAVESEADSADSTSETESSKTTKLSALEEAAKKYGSEYTGDPVNLTFWYLNTRQEGTDKLTEIWNQQNPNVQVTVSYYDTDGIKDACKTAAQSDSMPSMWFNWGGALGQYYVENGLTYDLTEYANKHGWNESVNAGALSLVKLCDQISGYPTSFNVIGMFYRTDIFEECGLKVPTTIEEFDNVCATLKEHGYTPISTAGLNGWHVMRLIEQFIEAEAGADTHDSLQALTTSWDNDAVVKAFERYQTYCQNGYFPDGFVTANPDDTYMAFAQGTAAMDIQGQWYDSTLQNNGVTLDNVSWFPFPNGTGRMSAFAEMTQFSAKLTEAELDAAMAYMHFIFSNEATKEYPTYYNLPLPYNNADPVDSTVNPHVQDMLDTASKNGTFTITDQAFPAEVADVLFNYQDAIANGESTPAEAAPAIQAAIEAYQSK
ncbi:MAG: Extracellular solute-binding protein [Lachnoclostridium sp.]|jgi:raffinose/stachyose/melibiose transport system substrate-binding protein